MSFVACGDLSFYSQASQKAAEQGSYSACLIRAFPSYLVFELRNFRTDIHCAKDVLRCSGRPYRQPRAIVAYPCDRVTGPVRITEFLPEEQKTEVCGSRRGQVGPRRRPQQLGNSRILSNSQHAHLVRIRGRIDRGAKRQSKRVYRLHERKLGNRCLRPAAKVDFGLRKPLGSRNSRTAHTWSAQRSHR